MQGPKLPRAPSHLSAASKKWFREVVSAYELEPSHLRLLTLAAEAWDRATEARKVLAEEGIITHDRYNKPKAHPCVAIERDSRLAFARLLRELDLDASAPPDTRPPHLQRYR
jgi:P27 family predicted phage terminase small subunit